VKVSTGRTEERAAPYGHAGLLVEIASLEASIEVADDGERRRLEASLDVLASYELALAACEDAGVSPVRIAELSRRAARDAAHAYASTAQRQRTRPMGMTRP
jgi:hypothetical protein